MTNLGDILVKLSQRINKNDYQYWAISFDNDHWKCMICHQHIKYKCGLAIEHGILHLKERNLLPFL